MAKIKNNKENDFDFNVPNSDGEVVTFKIPGGKKFDDTTPFEPGFAEIPDEILEIGMKNPAIKAWFDENKLEKVNSIPERAQAETKPTGKKK